MGKINSEDFRKYLPWILVLSSLIGTAYVMRKDVSGLCETAKAHEARIQEYEKKIEVMEASYREQLRRIEEKLDDYKESTEKKLDAYKEAQDAINNQVLKFFYDELQIDADERCFCLHFDSVL